MPIDDSRSHLWNVGYSTIQELETENGILASGREEIYGCIFGRDSLITAMQLLEAYRKEGYTYFLPLVRKILFNLIALQGTQFNIQSGEEPGKCIHEFRPTNHEHLTKNLPVPWYVYPDNVMRNYDSVDATPLLLMAIHEYYRTSGDKEFIDKILSNIELALDWLLIYGDSNSDGLIDYRFHSERSFGGLVTQSWMDSAESVFHETDLPVTFPLAPVEVQAYSYVALRAWAEFFSSSKPERSFRLNQRAEELKQTFHEKFILEAADAFCLAFAVDGNGQPLTAPRSSMAHCLWAVHRTGSGLDGILRPEYISKVVGRLMARDLFVPEAGIRSVSSTSPIHLI